MLFHHTESADTEDIYFSQSIKVLRCRGCDALVTRLFEDCSEDYDFEEDPETGEPEMVHVSAVDVSVTFPSSSVVRMVGRTNFGEVNYTSPETRVEEIPQGEPKDDEVKKTSENIPKSEIQAQTGLKIVFLEFLTY